MLSNSESDQIPEDKISRPLEKIYDHFFNARSHDDFGIDEYYVVFDISMDWAEAIRRICFLEECGFLNSVEFVRIHWNMLTKLSGCPKDFPKVLRRLGEKGYFIFGPEDGPFDKNGLPLWIRRKEREYNVGERRPRRPREAKREGDE